MSREQKYTAIILKKQPFGESDEIVTFYTEEGGKVRGLAKSVKSSKSKLQQRLQSLFLVELTLTGLKLPKIITAEPVEVFAGLRENLAALKRAFYGVELVLKFTPDEEKNQPLFELLKSFLEYLNTDRTEEELDTGLLKFKTGILSILGFNFSYSQQADKLLPQLKQVLTELPKADFKNLKPVELNPAALLELSNLLSGFIEYQLERKVKSERYLKSGVL